MWITKPPHVCWTPSWFVPWIALASFSVPDLLRRRYQKFRRMGQFLEVAVKVGALLQPSLADWQLRPPSAIVTRPDLS